MKDLTQSRALDGFDAIEEAPTGNLWSSVWRRKSLLALGIVVGIAAGSLHYSRLKPVYESGAQVLVVKKQADTGVPQGALASAYVEDYVSAHATLIKSPLIVSRAVKEGALAKLPSFAGSADPTGRIISALSVERENSEAQVGSSNILNLQFRGPHPEDCRLVLDAIISSYEKFLDETYQNVNRDTLEQLTRKAEVLEQELLEKTTAYRAFRETTPLLPVSADGSSLQQNRLAAIEAEISALRIRRVETEARLKTVKQLREEGDAEALAAVVAEWRTSSEPGPLRPEPRRNLLETLDEKLLPLRIEEKTLLERYGPEHPKVQTVRTQIELTRDLYERLASAQSALAEAPAEDEPAGDPVGGYVRSLERQLTETGESERALAEMLAGEQDKAKTLADFAFDDQRHRDEIARAEKFYDTLLTQLDGIDLSKDLGGYTTSTITPATRNDLPVEPKLVRTMIMAGVLGFLAGLVLVWLAEISDKSFRNPEEIQRRLGLPVIGHIPLIKPDQETLRLAASASPAPEPLLVTHYRPKSVESEAFRGLRTSLYFSTRGGGHKAIQVTSPESGDGKTTLAANLAVSIAQSGKRVLLIDGDFRKPRQHKLFAVRNDRGLAGVIADDLDPQDAICETAVPGLSLMPCGPQPPNPAELLTSRRFEELLELLREQFDFVVIDSPPLLAVSDPSIIAARVDGVLLTIRVTKHGRPKAERARELLETMGATIMGVAVNGHRAQRGYGYGYGYGSAYGYGTGAPYGDEERTNGDAADPPAHSPAPLAARRLRETDVAAR